MLTIVLAALTAVQSAAPMAIDPPATPTPVVIMANTPPGGDEHLARAKKALEAGDFAEARREYVIAAALDRDAGKVPAASEFGLAYVMYAQGQDREAAVVLDRLAADAQAKGDRDTEARALVDAMWLNYNARQYAQARGNARRLRVILKDPQLSPEVRRHVQSRIS